MDRSKNWFNLALLILLVVTVEYGGEKRAIAFPCESWEKALVVCYARIM